MNTSAYDFDILVVGAGPAGLSAARIAAENNMSVGIVDDNPRAGGQIWRQGPEHHAVGQARELIRYLGNQTNVTALNGTRIVQPLDRQCLLAEDAQRHLTLAYERLVIACGARERFLPFPGWTLPGVTGAGGLQALIKAGTPVKGQRIVVAGSGPLLWAAAATARSHGARIMAIVEQAPTPAVVRFAGSLARTPAKLAQALRLRLGLYRTPYLRGAWVAAAHGDGQLSRVTVHCHGDDTEIDCDRLACGYGLMPNTELAASLGCKLRSESEAPSIAVDGRQATSVPDIYAAGDCTGIGGMELSVIEGKIAAYAALDRPDAAQKLFRGRTRYQAFGTRLGTAFTLNRALKSLARPDTVFCRCEDVVYADVAAHASWRNVKLQTRCGMGPCQGKICGSAAAFCFGWGPQYDGKPVTPRTPLAPTRIATLLQGDTRTDNATPGSNTEHAP